MKKTVVSLIICVALFLVGNGLILEGDKKTEAIEPEQFAHLNYSDIYPDMYIGSDETMVYGSFAYFGESEATAEQDVYITYTGFNTDGGGQFMAFAIPSSQAYAAEEHMDKTLNWLKTGDMTAPSGYPIKGVVKSMTEEMSIYFEEYFVEYRFFTQEEIDADPAMLSDYYIDTSAQPNDFLGYFLIGSFFSTASIVGFIAIVIVSASNRNKARYKKDYAYTSTANSANSNLKDSTDVPLGFDK